MILETILFTALPTARKGNELFASVLISPQLGGEEGNPKHLLHDLGMAIDQVVEYHGLVACAVKGSNGMTADVSRPSGDQNPHESTPTGRAMGPR